MVESKNKKVLFSVILGVIIILLLGFIFRSKLLPYRYSTIAPEEVVADTTYMFGIPIDFYDIEEGEIKSGETLSAIFNRYGISSKTIDIVAKKSEGVFPVKNIRAGHPYTVFMTHKDSVSVLSHFVYEENYSDYVVFSLYGDSVEIKKDAKQVDMRLNKANLTIESSLWNCMKDNDIDPVLAMEMSDIFAWTIDFFALQKGDSFNVLYEEKFIDTVSYGIGRVVGAIFNHGGKDYYAFYYPQDENDKDVYWNEKGESLRKNVLKSPLKFFSRISSKFSNSRLHPILRIRRPHHGVDYAAPSGTPVYAVADGSVIQKGYAGGGGNTVKIRHASGLESGYLHLKGYAKGLSKGKRVSQGELIGYVGSTGLSSGPHLDYRVWKNGKAIDPLKIPAEPVKPIREEHKVPYNQAKDRILSVLEGRLHKDSLYVVKTDTLAVNPN